MTKVVVFGAVLVFALVPATQGAAETTNVPDEEIAKQRAMLAATTDRAGFGPQSPRDIEQATGQNTRVFGHSPARSEMTLCDIHFHENAEHKGGQFTDYAGNGDGEGNGTGFRYTGTLADAELAPYNRKVGVSKHGDLVPGDTIEIHFVFSTAQASLGNGLGTCFNDSISNPQLRVEAVVGVLVNDPNATDFTEMAAIETIDGLYQVPNLPDTLGTPVSYAGSTTGPGFNETASPFQVTWNVRPNVVKLNIASLAAWLMDNPFNETHAHGVRNLVVNPTLLSQID